MSENETEHAQSLLRQRAKLALRNRMRMVREAIPSSACEARSAEIAKRLLLLEEFDRASTVLAFAPIRNEVRTRSSMQAAWAAGKHVALPRVVEDELNAQAGRFGKPCWSRARFRVSGAARNTASRGSQSRWISLWFPRWRSTLVATGSGTGAVTMTELIPQLRTRMHLRGGLRFSVDLRSARAALRRGGRPRRHRRRVHSPRVSAGRSEAAAVV